MTFDFVQEMKRQKRPPKMIKKMNIINNQQIVMLPNWLSSAIKK